MWFGGKQTSLDGKTVLITGGSSGVGASFCKQLLDQHSARLIVVDLVEPSVECAFFKCDLSIKTEVKQVFGEIARVHGVPDVLIFNAGVQYSLLLDEISEDQYERIMNVNAVNLYYAVKPFLAGLKQRQTGHIVFTCSVCSFIYAPGAIPYCASKAAAFSFANGLRSELQDYSINVSTLTPGHINTAMFRQFDMKYPLLMPSLEADCVAKGMLDILLSNTSRQWMWPLYTVAGPLLMLLPPTWALYCQRLLGGDVAILKKIN